MLEKVAYVDEVNGNRVEAFTDGYAYDEYRCVCLLSVAGRESNVKAVTSAITGGRPVQVAGAEQTELCAPFDRHYRIKGTKLPGSLLHQVVADEGFYPVAGEGPRLVYAGDAEPADAVYEAVRSACPVPLIPEWRDWLYRALVEEGYAQELLGNRKVVRLDVDEAGLDALVSEAVKRKEIQF